MEGRPGQQVIPGCMTGKSDRDSFFTFRLRFRQVMAAIAPDAYLRIPPPSLKYDKCRRHQRDAPAKGRETESLRKTGTQKFPLPPRPGGILRRGILPHCTDRCRFKATPIASCAFSQAERRHIFIIAKKMTDIAHPFLKPVCRSDRIENELSRHLPGKPADRAPPRAVHRDDIDRVYLFHPA